MRKKKLLIMTDSVKVFTGFANVGRHVADYLHDTNKYEIAYLCWFDAPLNNIVPKYTTYSTLRDHSRCCGRGPVVVKQEVDKQPIYLKHHQGILLPIGDGPTCFNGPNMEHDKYAYESLHGTILDFQPDIVWSVSDCWMQFHTNMMDIRNCFQYYSYFPIDGSPMPHINEMGNMNINWIDTINKADKSFAFCDFGRDTMIKTGDLYGTDLKKVGVIYHGCDTVTYRPLPNKSELKKRLFNLEEKTFLVGCFSRNQPRKAFHKLMEALAIGKKKGYWKDGSDIKCYFHCFTEGHFINTLNGMIDIKNIKEGDKVLTHTGVFKEVVATKNRDYEGDLVKITTGFNDKELTSTDTHRYFAIKSDNCDLKHRDNLICKPTCSQQFRKYIKEDGTISYWNQCASKPYKNYKLTKVEAKDLEVGDIVAYPLYSSEPREDKNNLLFQMEGVTEDLRNDLFKIIGLYLAEGNISGPTDNYISFTFNQDEMSFVELISKTFKKMNINSTFVDIPERHAIRIIVNSSRWARFFKDQFKTGSHEKRIPYWLLKYSHQWHQELVLQYYFMGDGNVTKNGYEINTVSYNLIHDIRTILLNTFVIPSSISTRIAGESSYKPGAISYRLTITGESARRMYSNCNLSRYETYNANERSYNRSWIEYQDGNIYVFSFIEKVEITKDQKVKVYNFQVDEDESYTVDGVLSSNCPVRDVGWNLPDLIKTHGLEDIVILNDKLQVGTGPSDEQMNELYNACDVMSLPSRGEGWGLTYSEAMAAGVPVLMSAYSAHHDWAGHAAARIKIAALDSEPLTNIDRAIVDTDDYCEKINAFKNNISIEEFVAKFGPVTDYKDEKNV